MSVLITSLTPGKALRSVKLADDKEDNKRPKINHNARLLARCLRAKAFHDELSKIEPTKSGEGVPCGVCMDHYPKSGTVNCGDAEHLVCVHCFRGYVLTTHGAAGMAGVPCTAAASGICTRSYPPSAFRACLTGACAAWQMTADGHSTSASRPFRTLGL
jgi:hypothetical protein